MSGNSAFDGITDRYKNNSEREASHRARVEGYAAKQVALQEAALQASQAALEEQRRQNEQALTEQQKHNEQVVLLAREEAQKQEAHRQLMLDIVHLEKSNVEGRVELLSSRVRESAFENCAAELAQSLVEKFSPTIKEKLKEQSKLSTERIESLRQKQAIAKELGDLKEAEKPVMDKEIEKHVAWMKRPLGVRVVLWFLAICFTFGFAYFRLIEASLINRKAKRYLPEFEERMRQYDTEQARYNSAKEAIAQRLAAVEGKIAEIDSRIGALKEALRSEILAYLRKALVTQEAECEGVVWSHLLREMCGYQRRFPTACHISPDLGITRAGAFSDIRFSLFPDKVTSVVLTHCNL